MSPGSPTTAAPGATQDMILSLRAELVAGNVLNARMKPWGPYRQRYWAPHLNGIYLGYNVRAHLRDDVQVVAQIPFTSNVGNIYFEDAGDWASFPDDYSPSGQAEQQEALTANQIQISWTSSYKVAEPYGDTQLSDFIISGAKRGRNVAMFQQSRTRGRISYSITTISYVHIIRFWMNDMLVAEGSREGNGVVELTAMNGSGLSAEAELTFTEDIPPNVAFVDLRWPAGFQVHYATSPLSFPRSYQALVQDSGRDNYIFLSPRLDGGVYYYNVLTISDEGKVQDSAFVSTDALTINAGPTAPTITSVTGTANALTVHWTVGEAGCIYTAYSSMVNAPINFGAAASPAPAGTVLNGTSVTLPPVTGYTAIDHTSDIVALRTAFDFGIADVNTAFDAGPTDFNTAFIAATDDIVAGIVALELALLVDLYEYRNAVLLQAQIVVDVANALTDTALATDDWKEAIAPALSSFFTLCGSILSGETGRYTFSNGALPNAALPTAGVGVGAANDGAAGGAPGFGTPLYEVAKPYVETAKVRIVVRATKGGVEEQQDSEFIVELDDAGIIVHPRPNKANIESYTVTGGLTLNVTASVIEDDNSEDAVAVELFVVPIDSEFNFGSPVATEDLGTAYANYHSADLTYAVADDGWYKIAVRGRTADGTLSADYEPINVYISNVTPEAVTSLSAKIIRGRGISLD